MGFKKNGTWNIGDDIAYGVGHIIHILSIHPRHGYPTAFEHINMMFTNHHIHLRRCGEKNKRQNRQAQNGNALNE